MVGDHSTLSAWLLRVLNDGIPCMLTMAMIDLHIPSLDNRSTVYYNEGAYFQSSTQETTLQLSGEWSLLQYTVAK